MCMEEVMSGNGERYGGEDEEMWKKPDGARGGAQEKSKDKEEVEMR